MTQPTTKDPSESPDELAEALAKLSPEEAEMFVRALELTLKRRRLLLFGYLASLAVLVIGLAAAFYVYGTRAPGTFVGWVFLIPLALVGVILMVFGRLAKRPPPEIGPGKPAKP